VLSKTLDEVAWKNTRIIRQVDEIRELKKKRGKDIYAVGAATLVSSLMNLGLIDELQLRVNPIILAGGKALFNGLIINVAPTRGLVILGELEILFESNTEIEFDSLFATYTNPV
jgi:dihydrofolate reductase